MQTTLNFIPIDYDYFDFNSNNYVKIIGRDEKGKRICVIDKFEPYLWAILKQNIEEKKIKEIQNKIEKIKVDKAGRQSEVIKTEVHNKKFLGEDVKAIKIFITNYKDAHAVADEIDFKEIDKRRGYDVSLLTQYIIDRKIKPLNWYKIKGEVLNNSQEFGAIDSSLEVDTCIHINSIEELKSQQEFKPKILAYDIETQELEIGKGEILMISLVGNDFKKVLTWKHKSNQDYVEHYKDEADMIEGFIKHVKKYDPDILTGYFSDGFDLPYLRARAEKNNIKLNLGIDNSQPKFSRGRILTGKIFGIVHLDLLRFIQTAYSQYMQSETLSLNEVASEFLGEKKLDFSPLEHAKLEKPNWEDFFKYNLQDSVLTYRLAEKFWPDLLEFAKIIQEPLFNVSRDSMSAHVENYILHNLETYNEIAEKHPHYDEIGERRTREKYEGAFVFQPIPGLYENICFFDFSSMYASIIVSYNLSKSTLTKNKKNSYESEIENKKIYFKKTSGFFPEMLKEIIKKRREFKEEYKKNENPILKARSNAFKLIANAAYGYQGFFGARYYCLEAAASTAYFARQNIKSLIDNINKEDYTVIYSDTDSCCFKLNKHTKAEVKEFLKKLNKNLPGIMELELEDFYKRGIWVTKRTGEFGAKKKYALINEQNKIKIRGFETVRRDWCDLSRSVQSHILELILKEGNEKKSFEYLKQIVKKIKKREIEIKDLMIRTQLKKPIEEYKSINPHVTIAKRMREMQIPIDIGMLIEYYISEPENNQKTKTGKTKALVRERAKLPSEKGEYDIDYYLNNQILPAVENIFEVFKINVRETFEEKKQMKLREF
ncbi:MAG: DNA-directed DNA polymerase [Nanoarchaeota archaeon]